MQNNFEKQVKDKMDELRFEPKPPVWQNIEAQIRQKKERRRIIFWLPLLLLLAGGGVWWMMARTDVPALQTAQTVKTPLEKKKTTGLQSNSQPIQQEGNPEIKDRSKEPSHADDNIKQNDVTGQPVISLTESEADQLEVKAKPTTKYSLHNSISRKQSPGKKAHLQGVPDQKKKQQNATVLTETNEERLPVATTETAPLQQPEPVIVKDKEMPEKPIEKKGDSAQTQSPAEKNIKVRPPSAWKVAASFSIGTSGLANGFDLFGQKSATRSVVQQSAPSPSPVVVTPGKPSNVQNGISFSAGFTAIKPVSNRLSFTTGLQYHYFSNTIKVGQFYRLDTLTGAGSITNAFYDNRGSVANDRNNHFHFISIPAGIQWRLHQRLPLFLETGLSLRYLFATNTVLYDEANNIYYEDKDALRRMQVFTHLGFQYRLLNKKSVALLAGPQFQYSLTGLTLNAGANHLFSAGIGVQVQWKK